MAKEKFSPVKLKLLRAQKVNGQSEKAGAVVTISEKADYIFLTRTKRATEDLKVKVVDPIQELIDAKDKPAKPVDTNPDDSNPDDGKKE